MKKQSREDKWTIIILPAFAIYVFILLWVTLFSRIGTGNRYYYEPLWSYKAIAAGNLQVLLEDIGNVLLFLPLGLGLSYLTGWKKSVVLFVGCIASSLIETLQWHFWLGSTELDDIINNTLGTVLGSLMAPVRHGERLSFSGKNVCATVTVTLVLLALTVGFQQYKFNHMKDLASYYDLEDGAKNLLILNGDSGYVGDTKMYVSYDEKGALIISGSSDKIAYKLIGTINLQPGRYSFSGFSDMKEKTVGIYLETFQGDNFYRYTPDLGPTDCIEFTLENTEIIRAFIKTYPGAAGEYLATPVIYREDRNA